MWLNKAIFCGITQYSGYIPLNLRTNIRKALYSFALLVGASWGVAPLFASASILSFFTQPVSQTWPATPAYFNSQNIPLLSPAINLDPHPSAGGGDISMVGGQALLAQEGPSGTAADLPETPINSQISVYTVREGDTLSGIASMFSVSVGTIIGANNLQGKSIQPGQQLIILPITGIEHTVQKGDTIAAIAKKYKSDAGDIAQYNDLAGDASLVVGDKLIIPNGETPTPVVAKKSTTKKKIGAEPYLGGSGPSISGYYAWPVAAGVITQGLHGWNGVDIGGPLGTNIFASAGGTVIIAKNNNAWNGGYGKYVVISHPNGTQTLYSHMSSVSVSPGQSVGQGETIGKMGSTGLSTGSHLHFEVRGAVNPFAN